VNLASGHISIVYGARGRNPPPLRPARSAHAIGDSSKLSSAVPLDDDLRRHGSTITPMGIGGFASMKALSTRNDDPAHRLPPVDAGAMDLWSQRARGCDP